ncbi:MAG: sigma-70 family RNA polymerase sigma factor [Lachnospiraceae bacterium]|nr:sigma-70 family RNA polymerase sigma factor [Lachnospiraceae bacterium]
MVKADKEGIQQKIDSYGDMLFRLSYMRLQNVQDAEDAVQEVFYQYLKKPQVFENPEHEKAWFLKVALNVCRKTWRSAWRRHQSSWQSPEDGGSDGDWTEILEQGGSTGGVQPLSGPEELAVRQEERSRLLHAVLALPERYREVIHLFYYEELSVKEISRITGGGISTITSRLTRGRELLKKSLKEEYDFG